MCVRACVQTVHAHACVRQCVRTCALVCTCTCAGLEVGKPKKGFISAACTESAPSGTPHHGIPHHTMPRHATSRHATPHHATPRHATPRTPCYTAPHVHTTDRLESALMWMPESGKGAQRTAPHFYSVPGRYNGCNNSRNNSFTNSRYISRDDACVLLSLIFLSLSFLSL